MGFIYELDPDRKMGGVGQVISTETELGTKNALLDDLCPTVDNCLPTFFEDEEDMGKPPTLTERMENVEAALKLRPKETSKDWNKKKWITIASIGLGAAALVVAYFAWWQPQWKTDADVTLTNKINSQIEAKLNDHQFDKMGRDISDIEECLCSYYSNKSNTKLSKPSRIDRAFTRPASSLIVHTW